MQLPLFPVASFVVKGMVAGRPLSKSRHRCLDYYCEIHSIVEKAYRSFNASGRFLDIQDEQQFKAKIDNVARELIRRLQLFLDENRVRH